MIIAAGITRRLFNFWLKHQTLNPTRFSNNKRRQLLGFKTMGFASVRHATLPGNQEILTRSTVNGHY